MGSPKLGWSFGIHECLVLQYFSSTEVVDIYIKKSMWFIGRTKQMQQTNKVCCICSDLPLCKWLLNLIWTRGTEFIKCEKQTGVIAALGDWSWSILQTGRKKGFLCYFFPSACLCWGSELQSRGASTFSSWLEVCNSRCWMTVCRLLMSHWWW